MKFIGKFWFLYIFHVFVYKLFIAGNPQWQIRMKSTAINFLCVCGIFPIVKFSFSHLIHLSSLLVQRFVIFLRDWNIQSWHGGHNWHSHIINKHVLMMEMREKSFVSSLLLSFAFPFYLLSIHSSLQNPPSLSSHLKSPDKCLTHPIQIGNINNMLLMVSQSTSEMFCVSVQNHTKKYLSLPFFWHLISPIFAYLFHESIDLHIFHPPAAVPIPFLCFRLLSR